MKLGQPRLQRMSVGREVRVPKPAVNSQSSAYRTSLESWFTPKRWITGVCSQAASIIEALGLSCLAVFDTSFLETLLPAITARKFGGDPPRMSVWTTGFGMGGGRSCGTRNVLIALLQTCSHSRGTIPDYTSTTSHSVVLDHVYFFAELSGGAENEL